MAKPADWITLHLKVTTPLFNGGADPDGKSGFRSDQEPGIRAASLRGAMRFWFRALAGTVAGDDLLLLAALERRVFGRAGEPSPVTVRITRQPETRHDTAADFLNGKERGQWIGYLLGQGLTEYDSRTHRMLLTRPYVPVGQDVTVKIGFAGGNSGQTAGALALASLWLCCTYGGIGARVRRGFGGLRITGASEPLPPPWTKTAIYGGGLATYERMRTLWPSGPLARCRALLADLRDAEHARLRPGEAPGVVFDDGWKVPPPYPVLSQKWTAVGLSGGDEFGGWDTTLWHAGEELRRFRADRPNRNPRARYEPKIETREWADVVHRGGRHFGVGALGLPVVYKGGYVVNADRGLGRHADLLRRASPLWLRAVGSGDHWRLLSFAFLGEFLPGPNAPAVHLWHEQNQRRQLDIAASDVSRLARQWIDALRADLSFDGQVRRS